jgi:enoyl-CoA hydratase/carnithine racemase
MSDYETVLYESRGNVVTITLNRPQRRNALNAALNRDLLAAFKEAGDDENARAIVLAGAGKSFCAGADLSAFTEMPTPDQVSRAIAD